MPRGEPFSLLKDDEHLRRMYRFALTFAGFQVREARNGLDALQALDRETPALVVLDLGLPDVSGFIVRQKIAAQAELRDIPILVVTGSTAPLEPSRSRMSLADTCVVGRLGAGN